jgi:uncharacterized RDD family membrane protein YckC
MTQPPDERDPQRPDSSPSADQPPSGEAPTQAWSTPPAPETASSDPATTPAPTVAWAAPTLAVQEVAPGLTWADIPSRFVAYVIDTFIVAFTGGVIIGVLGVGSSVPGQLDRDPTGGGLLSIVSTLVGAAYFIVSWSGGRRATLGQRVFKIQVGNAFDGRPLAATQAFKRWIGLGSVLGLLAVIPSVSLYGVASLAELVWTVVLLISTSTSPTKQGLHDRFANSAVVRPIGASTGLATTCLVIVIGLFVIALLSIIALIFLGGQVSAILSAVGESI